MQSGSLAVKYRPRTIKDLVGQPRVTADVQGMIDRKQIHNTILFAGGSGRGKTTTARMLTRYLNCDTFDACGKCPSCKMKDQHVDVTEVDAGSDRGIDSVRNLIRSSRNQPRYNYRCIIIDECHRLTSHAMEALLKPTEEPSPHTIWMLCTTEPERLPTTLLGRCYVLKFDPIEPEDVVKRLIWVTRREKIDPRKIGKAAYQEMANLSNGQMRDALQLLDSVLNAAHNGKTIDPKLVAEKFASQVGVDVDHASADVVAGALDGSLKTVVHAIRACDNPRGLLNKTRWLVQNLIDQSVGLAKYVPYQAKLFRTLASKKKIKYSLDELVKIQHLLTQIEVTMNTINADDSVVLMGAIGDYINREFE